MSFQIVFYFIYLFFIYQSTLRKFLCLAHLRASNCVWTVLRPKCVSSHPDMTKERLLKKSPPTTFPCCSLDHLPLITSGRREQFCTGDRKRGRQTVTHISLRPHTRASSLSFFSRVFYLFTNSVTFHIKSLVEENLRESTC